MSGYGVTMAPSHRVALLSRAWHLISCAYARQCGVPLRTVNRAARAIERAALRTR